MKYTPMLSSLPGLVTAAGTAVRGRRGGYAGWKSHKDLGWDPSGSAYLRLDLVQVTAPH